MVDSKANNMSQRILITGASGGFGQLSVKSLINNGHRVVASMRNTTGKNQQAAEELTQLGAHVVDMDVTSTESVDAAVAEAQQKWAGLDVIINNAGVGVMGMQEHFTPEDWQKLFDVNVFGVQRVNRAVVPALRAQGSGLIIYVSSLLGRMTLPFYGPYNASKWALEAMAENYRSELSGFGIETAIVEPGGFATSFMTSLMRPSDQSRDADYGDFMHVPGAMAEAFEQNLAGNTEQNPQKVADAIVNVIEAPEGQRPIRTVVDSMGMGAAIDPYNKNLEELTRGIYSAFQMGHLLDVKSPENAE